MPILSVKKVVKDYGSPSGVPSVALNGVSFDVDKGEFVSVMGPSGAGKTTLLNVIATIDGFTSGDVVIGEQSLRDLREPALSNFRRGCLGFVFQDYNLLDTLTLGENIALPLIMGKARGIDEQVDRVARQLGVEPLLAKYPCQVSGGQRQRAAAARAIIHKPELLLADEPTGALDSKSAANLLSCLEDIHREQQATILLVTHDAFAASFSQRTLFLRDGQLYRELHRRGSRREYYDEIIAVVSELGGDGRDLC